MASVVSLNHVIKRYRRGRQVVEVLHNLDLEVEAGEFLALMGPSGSGKTTLLNLIGGLDEPTEGELTVAGEEIYRMSGGELARWRSRHVGFVFQFYNLMPTLSAERTTGFFPVLRVGKASRLTFRSFVVHVLDPLPLMSPVG